MGEHMEAALRQQTITYLKAAAPKIDDALAVIDEAWRQLDSRSRTEELQDLFMELGSMLDSITSLEGDVQSLIDTYGDE